MLSFIQKHRAALPVRILSPYIVFVLIVFLILPPQWVQAQSALNLPAPGMMVPLSPGFQPVIMRGIKIHPQNPLQFDFIVHKGDWDQDLVSRIQNPDVRSLILDPGSQERLFKDEVSKLIKYFLAALTIPEEDLWVNLSPFEKGRIIPEKLGLTELGRDMLTQDYLLKQLTSTLTYPEDELGKAFWEKIRTKAFEQYGTTEIPMDTFHKVWIVPERAEVLEAGDTAWVVDSYLKVMLEEDYVAQQHSRSPAPLRANEVKRAEGVGEDYLALEQSYEDSKLNVGRSELKVEHSTLNVQHRMTNKIESEIIKELILPELEREINQGRNFAPLRQIYHSIILAMWFKLNLKQSLLGQSYVNQGKIDGVDVQDRDIQQKIYEQYLAAYQKGVYNYIREEDEYFASTKQTVPRKYFSGGEVLSETFALVAGGISHVGQPLSDAAMMGARALDEEWRRGELVNVAAALGEASESRVMDTSPDSAMMSSQQTDLWRFFNRQVDLDQNTGLAWLDEYASVFRGEEEIRRQLKKVIIGEVLSHPVYIKTPEGIFEAENLEQITVGPHSVLYATLGPEWDHRGPKQDGSVSPREIIFVPDEREFNPEFPLLSNERTFWAVLNGLLNTNGTMRIEEGTLTQAFGGESFEDVLRRELAIVLALREAGGEGATQEAAQNFLSQVRAQLGFDPQINTDLTTTEDRFYRALDNSLGPDAFPLDSEGSDNLPQFYRSRPLQPEQAQEWDEALRTALWVILTGGPRQAARDYLRKLTDYGQNNNLSYLRASYRNPLSDSSFSDNHLIELTRALAFSPGQVPVAGLARLSLAYPWEDSRFFPIKKLVLQALIDASRSRELDYRSRFWGLLALQQAIFHIGTEGLDLQDFEWHALPPEGILKMRVIGADEAIPAQMRRLKKIGLTQAPEEEDELLEGLLAIGSDDALRFLAVQSTLYQRRISIPSEALEETSAFSRRPVQERYPLWESPLPSNRSPHSSDWDGGPFSFPAHGEPTLRDRVEADHRYTIRRGVVQKGILRPEAYWIKRIILTSLTRDESALDGLIEEMKEQVPEHIWRLPFFRIILESAKNYVGVKNLREVEAIMESAEDFYTAVGELSRVQEDQRPRAREFLHHLLQTHELEQGLDRYFVLGMLLNLDDGIRRDFQPHHIDRLSRVLRPQEDEAMLTIFEGETIEAVAETIRQAMERPIAKGNGFVVISATPEEAKDFQETWNGSRGPLNYMGRFAGKDYRIPIGVWRKMIAWFEEKSTVPRSGNFVFEERNGVLHAIDFVPYPGFSIDADYFSKYRESPTAVQVFIPFASPSFSDDEQKNLSSLLNWNLDVEKELFLRHVVAQRKGGSPLPPMIPVYSRPTTSLQTGAPEKTGSSRPRIYYSLGEGFAYMYNGQIMKQWPYAIDVSGEGVSERVEVEVGDAFRIVNGEAQAGIRIQGVDISKKEVHFFITREGESRERLISRRENEHITVEDLGRITVSSLSEPIEGVGIVGLEIHSRSPDAAMMTEEDWQLERRARGKIIRDSENIGLAPPFSQKLINLIQGWGIYQGREQIFLSASVTSTGWPSEVMRQLEEVFDFNTSAVVGGKGRILKVLSQFNGQTLSEAFANQTDAGVLSVRQLADLPPFQTAMMVADWNTPRTANTVTDDQRIQDSFPTIETLLNRNDTQYVFLLTHSGRPNGEGFEPDLSLAPMAKRAEELLAGRAAVVLLPYDLDEAEKVMTEKKAALAGQKILFVFENIRFYPQERSERPDVRIGFEERLKRMTGAQVYVHEAFDKAHRDQQASMELIRLFEPEYRAAGLDVGDKMRQFLTFETNARHPWVVVFGGAKFDKYKGIAALAQKLSAQDTLVIAGALAHPWLKAAGAEVGGALMPKKEKEIRIVAEAIPAIQAAQKSQGFTIIVPTDFVLEGETQAVSEIRIGASALDAGPQTIQQISQAIKDASQQQGTVLINGGLGVFEEPNYRGGTRAVVVGANQAVQQGATVLAMGGDMTSAVRLLEDEGSLRIDDQFLRVTGGGVILEIVNQGLAGLPTLNALLKSKDAAMASDSTGGVNVSSIRQTINVQQTDSGAGFSVPMQPVEIEIKNGLSPTILRVFPLQSLPFSFSALERNVEMSKLN